ncbi:MAG: hypothetical protein M1820_003291 [Bogoriella megaspora]|nr:MAG: hypothetical protein M1820_003291 [Bogoriella megaspora]
MSTSDSSPDAALENQISSSGPQKRNRIQLSCTLCRTAKLKCNRARPSCDQCQKRARSEQCYYAPPPIRKQPPQDMRGRVRHLERLVVDLMQSKGNGIPNGSSNANGARSSSTGNGQVTSSNQEQSDGMDDQDRATDDLGKLKISKNESTYVGSSHWAAILKDIEEVKDYLDEDQCVEDDDGLGGFSPESAEESFGDERSDISMMLGHSRVTTRTQLLNGMPEKAVVDRLISEWFNSFDPFLHIIHAPTFQEEYRNFWANPQRTPTMWIGMLFGIMSLAVFFRHRSEARGCAPPKPITDTINRYRSYATSAMIIADYTSGKPYTIECLMICASNQHLLAVDNQHTVWVMLGLAIRLAIRMGYHRDPSHFPEIGFLQGEMRRRIFHLMTQLDVLISFQQGLPCLVRAIPSDIRPPSNLRDTDFNALTKEPPPPRPLSEMTPVSYSIAKWRICAVFAEACDVSHSVTPPTYGEVLDLDKRMREAYGLIPPALRVRPMDQMVTDTPEAIMCRFNLELLYLKSQCVLHRRFLNERQTDTRHTYSRKTCLEAATELLKYHEIIHYAVYPGGRLERYRWYMSSITSHNFLLASMIICLELTFYHDADPTAANAMREQLSWNQDEAIALLRKSYEIWGTVKDVSKDAQKASQILGILLKKVKAVPGSAATKASPQNSEVSNGSLASNEDSDFSSFGGIDLSTQQGSVAGQPFQFQTPDQTLLAAPPDFGPIGDMLDMPENIDWNVWDTKIQNQVGDTLNNATDDWPLDLEMTDPLAMAAPQMNTEGNWVWPGDKEIGQGFYN